jgi:hypothetical protein
MVTRIVFLDMDGVLNSHEFFNGRKPWTNSPPDDKRPEYWAVMVDPEAVERLNRIIAATGAKVVISSSWRYHVPPDMMQKVLELRGFKGEVIGRTPTAGQVHASGILVSLTRGHEIETWLVKNRHLNVMDYFVILDDMGPTQFAHLPGHHVETSWGKGLLDEHVPRAIDILSDA